MIFKYKQTVNIHSSKLEIQGFPKLDKYLIKSKITFRRYQFEHAFGYLAEHFETNED